MQPASSSELVSDWDERTISACRRGDRHALERVLRKEAPVLRGIIGRLVGSRSDVDDVLQKSLITAVRAFPRFRGEAAVRTWLVGIAVKTALEHLRSPQRHRALELVADANLEAIAVGPEQALEDRRRVDRLREHLQAIAPKKRVAFVLHVFEGYAMDEVAVLVGASRAATKSRVFFARRELLKRMRRDPLLADLFEAGEP